MSESIQRIEFLETLGRGGFGAVYLAQVTRSDRFVQRMAVKIMSLEHRDQPDLVARQRDEARLLAQLNHDHIVKVIDMSEVHGRPALFMEYIEGVDGHTMRQYGPLPVAAALEIVQATASALDAAWNTPSTLTGQPLRVIHRDIKPSNLLISRHGGLKVLDFGVARADFDREGTTTSMQYGTARFMAPEQWLSGALSHTVDIYALGVCAFELLTGQKFQRLPLQPDRFLESLNNRITSLELQSQTQSVQCQIHNLIQRMLSYRPEERPSAREVQEQCISILSNADGESLAEVARRIVPSLHEQIRATYKGEPQLSDYIRGTANIEDLKERFPIVESAITVEPNSLDTLQSPVSDLPTRPRRAIPPPSTARNPTRLTGIILILSAGVLGWWIAQPALETNDVSTPMKLDDATTSVDVPTPSINNATIVSEDLDPIRNSEVPIQTTRTPSETHEKPTASTSVLATSTSSQSDPKPESTTVVKPPTSQLKRTQTSLDPVVIPIENDPILVSFILNSDPWGAAVSINGQPLGTTPITNRQLPAGRHSIEFVYQGIHSTHEVQIIEGRDNHFKWTSSNQELRILQGRGQ